MHHYRECLVQKQRPSLNLSELVDFAAACTETLDQEMEALTNNWW